jgi:hypothetical protein
MHLRWNKGSSTVQAVQRKCFRERWETVNGEFMPAAVSFRRTKSWGDNVREKGPPQDRGRMAVRLELLASISR